MGYLFMGYDGGYLIVRAEYDGVRYPSQRYLYYSKRDAISKYRKLHGLEYKRLTPLNGGLVGNY